MNKTQANFLLWEREMRGRTLRARVAAKVEGIGIMARFYWEMFGPKR